MKTHFWAGDFTATRIRKTACGRNFLSSLEEADEINEFLGLPADKVCLSCRKFLVYGGRSNLFHTLKDKSG